MGAEPLGMEPLGAGALDQEQVTDAAEAPLSLRHYFQEYKAEMQPPPGLLSQIVDSGLDAAAQRPASAEAPRSQPTPESPQPWAWLRWTGWLSGWATAAVAAVFAIVWLPSPMNSQTGVVPPTKGATPRQAARTTAPPARRAASKKLVFVGKGASALTLLHARRTLRGFAHKQTTHHGTRLQSGDLVQLQYQTQQPLYVMMLSLNRKGEISLFIPYGKTHSAKIEQGKGHLPKSGSLELDDYVGIELFFVLSSPRPFPVKAARAAIKKAFQNAKQGSRWTQIRALPGPWSAQVIAIHKH